MKRELVVTVPGVAGGDKTVIVDGPLPDGRFRITIDGSERLVDGRAVHPGTWSLVLDGRSYVVDLDRRGKPSGAVAASVGSSNVTLSVEDALHKRLASAASPRAAARGESIRAPIAGKVVKVFVAPGDQVTPGTAVIVLEAMKMENELLAERGGTVASVTKTAGQAVDTGDLLVELI